MNGQLIDESSVTPVAEPGAPTFTFRPPNPRDPRLHVAMVLLTLQVLGQTLLDFELSIAQILCSILTCAVLEVTIVAFGTRVIAWPASAMLTGNGIALLLRIPGTRHGDWWSLHGAWIFIAVAAFSLATKYLVRFRGRQVFNPSNLGLALCFLILGSDRVDPQDLWWGPMSATIVIVLTLITVGGLVITSRNGLLPIAMAFWLTFATGMGVLGANGHCISARWNLVPVCGTSFWSVLVFSPEILVFLFFMITDPKTVPRTRIGRAGFGMLVGGLAALIVAAQSTEYATKTGILVALCIACAARPFLASLAPAVVTARQLRRVVAVVVAVSVLAVAVYGIDATMVSPGGDDLAAASLTNALPPVSIDPEVEHAVSGIDMTLARQMTADLIRDLADEAEAIGLGDAARARRALTGARLERALDRLRTSRQDEPVTVQTYEFDTVRLVLAGERPSPQSLPRLGLEATGTVRSTTWYSGEPTREGEPRAFSATFAVVRSGDRFLLAGDDGSGRLDEVEPATIPAASVLDRVRIGGAIDEGAQPGQLPLFEDVTDVAGVRIDTTSLRVDDLPEPSPNYWDSGSTFDVLNSVERYQAAGQAWGDVDGDGRVDLFLTDQVGPNRLFLNVGGGRFEPAPEALAGPIRLADVPSGGANFVDYDNSGRPSLLVLTDGGPRLFHNEGGTRFVDVTRESGLVDNGKGQTAAWGDLNGDGLLDVFIANYGCQPCSLQNRPPFDLGQGKLFVNAGGGRFDDRTSWLSDLPGVRGKGFSASWLDYDDDGRLDLAIVNDVRSNQSAAVTGTDEPAADGDAPGNALLHNDGPGCDGWCFSDASQMYGDTVRGAYMGLASGDFSGDGRQDMFLPNGGFLFGAAVLLHNEGTRFANVAATRGADLGEWAWGSSPLDVDNDGALDAFTAVGYSDSMYMLRIPDLVDSAFADVPATRARIASGAAGLPVEAIRSPFPVAADPLPRTDNNRILLQRGERFEIVTTGQTDRLAPPHYSNAVADYDNDGWPDVVSGTLGSGYSLLRNRAEVGAGNHRVGFRLHGDGVKVNRDAVGAKIVVTDTDGTDHTAWVQMGGGLGGGSDTTVLIGLGRAGVTAAVVHWPDGTTQRLDTVAPDRLHSVTYGSSSIEAASFDSPQRSTPPR